MIAAGSPRVEGAGTELERTAVEFAERMARTDVEVDDALVARLRRELDDEQLLELAAWVALQSFYSSLNRALGIV